MPLDTSFPKPAPATIPLSHVLGALSHALDLTEGQPVGHCLRACWIGMGIGRALGLDAAALADLYYGVLLKDLGCSSNAARVAQLYLTDDLHFKAQAKFIGRGVGPAVRFIVAHTAGGEGFLTRLRTTWHALSKAGEIVHELVQTRCDRGAAIARQLRFSPAVAEGIHSLDEHWDGSGWPRGLRGQAIPLFSRIALLAQIADVFATAAGPGAAHDEIRGRTGTWFDPEVAAAFHGVAEEAGFWATFAAPDIERIVLDLEPAQRPVAVDDDYLDDVATAFAQVVDAKSPYTHGHSERVARFSLLLGAELGFNAAALQRLRRAALLHDLGKLAVSNSILDKPGRLDEAEWQAVRAHPVHSERILGRIPAFTELAEIGGAHHERLDGRGYPRGLSGAAIGLPTRIVTTADVCDALTARRPYRDPLPVAETLDIMRRDSGTAFDPVCLEALGRLAAAPDFLGMD
jgi:HD-GYP domain-containing protein (c-di-GMP phosphodiesterase class II)